jgi:hypothetical protein
VAELVVVVVAREARVVVRMVVGRADELEAGAEAEAADRHCLVSD